MASDLSAEKRLQTFQVGASIVLIIAVTAALFFLTQGHRVAFSRAEKAYSRKDYTAAARHYSAAGNFSLLHPVARYRAAHAWQETGELAKAAALYRELLISHPRDPAVVAAYAGIAQALGRPADAITAYETLGARDSLDAAQLAHLADIYQQAGRFPDAVATCRLALQRQPDARAPRLLLARVLSWSGRFEEAVIEYRHYLRE